MEQEFLADVILDIFEVSKAKEFIDSIWSCRDYAEVLQAARANPPGRGEGDTMRGRMPYWGTYRAQKCG